MRRPQQFCFFMIIIFNSFFPAWHTAAATVQTSNPLRIAVINEFLRLEQRHQGIFHEDVTAVVSNFIKSGETVALAESRLEDGSMDHFKQISEGPNGDIKLSSRSLISTSAAGAVYVLVVATGHKADGGIFLIKTVNAFIDADTL